MALNFINGLLGRVCSMNIAIDKLGDDENLFSFSTDTEDQCHLQRGIEE